MLQCTLALAVALAGAGFGGCAARTAASVRLELAVSGDRGVAAQRLVERVGALGEVDGVGVGPVEVREAPPDRLLVEVALAAGPRCEGFEAAADAVRALVARPVRLGFHETLSFGPDGRATVVAAVEARGGRLEDGAGEGDALPVSAPSGVDLGAVAREVSTPEAPVAFEPLAPGPRGSGRAQGRLWRLAPDSGLREGDIVGAEAGELDPTGRWGVRVELSAAGAQRFEALTARLVGRPIAIMVDGPVMSATWVQEPIHSGRLSITLGAAGPPAAARTEAVALAAALASGPLAERVDVASEARSCVPAN